MAVEQVTVLDAGPSSVRIRARDVQHCGRCAMKSGCGHQLLADTLSRRRRDHAIELPYADRAHPGQTLALAIDETRLMTLALLHYGLPVLCLLLATAVSARLAGGAEGVVIAAAAAAFAAGLVLVSRIAGRLSPPVTLGADYAAPRDTDFPIPDNRKPS